jgi:hypothetical protein
MRRISFVILAVLIVAAAVVYAIFARDLTAARARLVGRSMTMETSFGTLEYGVRTHCNVLVLVLPLRQQAFLPL